MNSPIIKTPRQLLFTQARQVAYVAVMCLVVILLWQLADLYKNTMFVGEFGLIETAQTAILLLASLSLGIQACGNRIYRPLLLLLGSLTLAAAIREQDAFFEHALPGISWYFCWIFPIAAIIYVIRLRRNSLPAFIAFLRSNSFNMMITASIIIIPIAQLLGHRSFLEDLINNPAVNTSQLRRIIEEPIELLGYLQILLATLEFHIEQWLDRH